jgi:hypothetical protein
MDNDTINNDILKIETLEKEYDVVLTQYQEAYKNYINTLNSGSSNPCSTYNLNSTGISQECYNKIWSDQGCITQAPGATSDWAKSQTYDGLINDSYLWSTLTDTDHRKGCYGDTTNYSTKTEPTYSLGKDFADLPGRTWWGTYGIKEGAASTKDECLSMCASDSNCTGATFNPVKRYCWARGGDGVISAGEKDDHALIPKLKVSILILNGLNEKLISINQQLRNEIKNLNPKIEEENTANTEKQEKFDDYYYKLSDEKKHIQKILRQYDTIEAELNDQTLVVDQANGSLKLWTFVAFILLLILLKQIYGIETPPTGIMMFITVIILLIVLSFSLSKPSGFATIGFVIIAAIAYKLNSDSTETN